MPLEVVDVCDDDGVSGESLIGKAGASRLFLFSACPKTIRSPSPAERSDALIN